MTNELVTKTVRRLISSIKMRPENLAKKLNVSVKSINRWVNGSVAPSASSLLVLIRLTGDPLVLEPEDYFLFGQVCLFGIQNQPNLGCFLL